MYGTTAWLKRLESLIAAQKVITRGMPVREEIAQSVVIDMNEPFVYDVTRKISNKFRFAEAYWILTGDNRVETIAPYAPSIEYFSDNGHVFQGAYGPKVTEQLQYVCDCLAKDPASRQAVLAIWRENPRDSRDIPCTLVMQFLIREGVLHCIATMRSSDVWLGLPYDMFNFSCIANWIRLALFEETEVLWDLGTLTIQMGSSHLYEKNYETALKVCDHADDDWTPDQLIKMPICFPGGPKAFIEWLKWGRDNA